jgi:hypothetical protein
MKDTCYWCGQEFEAPSEQDLRNEFIYHGETVHRRELENAANRIGQEKVPQDIAVKTIREGPQQVD